MNDSQQAALDRYKQHFDAEQYEGIAGLFASNLYSERDDPNVVAGLNLLIDTCLEVCGSVPHAESWHRFAVYCGQNSILKFTVDAVVRYLRHFAEDDVRVDDFECTAKALLVAYSAQSDANHASTQANGIHTWQGRAAYDLFVASDYFIQVAIQLLAHGDPIYTREKLQAGLGRITSALYEGVRASDDPALFDFKSVYFPDEHDT